MLNTERNTAAMEKKIITAARLYFRKRKGLSSFFEHGQWWIRIDNEDEDETYSVCDAEGPYAVKGFCFERI